MIVATLAALVVLPLVVLRGRTLAACYGSGAALALVLLLAARRIPHLDPYLGFVTLAVLELAVFAVYLAVGTNVRWSAGRAAIVAAIVYALLVPAMVRTPIDGDEPYYLLVTESLVHDRDFDLTNQYATLDRSATGRTDLVAQPGDPTGAHGERYSRHEPFLSFLLIPGYLVGGLYGALATMALFGVLLVRSTIRWLQDEGIDDAIIRAVFPFFALAPPVLFYAARIWPEVPAAFFFVEALRGVRQRRFQRWLPALAGLVLLKLRFVLVAAGLIVALLRGKRLPPRRLAILAVLVAVPLLVGWLVSGNPLNTHTWREVLPVSPMAYVRGLAGLLVDAQGGLLFQAPFLLVGVLAIAHWRDTPRGFRLGILASLLYILYLIPRAEWHGGWAPPLRYIVFLAPVLTLGAATLWPRISRGTISVIALWTLGIVIHGVTYPWRLFHIANGETAAGEWLSHLYGADFSRMFPSFIRVNEAGWIAFTLAVCAGVVRASGPRFYSPRAAYKARAGGAHYTGAHGEVFFATLVITVLLALGFATARKPAALIHFEDAHVLHRGGTLYPELYAVSRFAYRGGWTIHAGESMTFLAKKGTYTLDYATGLGALIELDGHAYQLPPSTQYAKAPITIEHEGRVTLRCISGAVNLDRMAQ